MSRPRAVITGLGAVSGFGAGAATLWRGLLGGERAIRRAPSLAAAGIADFASFLPGEDPLATGDRATPMALAAAAEAVAAAGGVTPGSRLGVAVGTTLGGMGAYLDLLRRREDASERRIAPWRWGAPGETIATAHGATGPVQVVSLACSSGNGALGAALALVRSGRCDQVIAGGVDALSDFVAAGFAALKALDAEPCRPFDRTRRGLTLGEGAGFLVVESEAFARARGATIHAVLAGYGVAADAVHMTAPDREGRGAAAAMAAALVDAGVAADAVDFVSAHGTATPFNDAMESRALVRLFGARASSVPVNSIKGAIGHTMGAAGALEALLCVYVIGSGEIPPTAGTVALDEELRLDVVRGEARRVDVATALSTSSGFGGVNAAIVLQRADSAGEGST